MQLASLDLQVGRLDAENMEQSLLTLKHEADLLEKKIDRALQKASATGAPSDYEIVDALETELDEVREALKSHRNSSLGMRVVSKNAFKTQNV